VCIFLFINEGYNSSMVRKKVTVKNESGLHARPASVLVQVASSFESEFTINMYGFNVNGKSILGVMTLAAEFGSEMELIFEGPDEKEALDAVVDLFETKFNGED
jgi:phosphocarrier protein